MIAWRLCLLGRRVLLLERGLVGGESSGVSFGSLRLQGQHEAELPLALCAQALWEGMEQALGESLEFVRHGHVHLALSDEHVARLEHNAATARAHGLEVTLLGGEATIVRWPFLGQAVRASSLSARDAVANPRLVAPAVARAARRLGAEIREGVEMVAATRAGAGFNLHCRGADAREFTIEAEVLVNAAGAWCGALAQQFNEAIPVIAAGPAELVTEPVPAFAAPVLHVVDGSVLFRQTARGNLVIGGHPRMSVDADSRRTRVPSEKILTNLARLVAVVPHLADYQLIRSWTGIEGYVEDMMPVLGPSMTTPGLFHACAFSGHGLQLGPAAAQALAELIAKGATSLPIARLGIGRFAGGGQGGTRMEEEFQDDVLRRRT